MIEHGFEPVQLETNVYQMPSQSGNGVYTVLNKYKAWFCDCPDYTNRHIECKHIHAIRFWQKLKAKLVAEQQQKSQELQAEIEANQSYDNFVCVYCGSENITKHGTRKTKIGNKTRMLCGHCNKTFTLESKAGFEKMQVTAKMVTVALDLYFKSTSLRKIVDHLDQFYERHVDHTTILYWANKYGEIISKYAETLKPELGNIWHADEMKMKTKRDEWVWLWHVMDGETRYMVANLITKRREDDDAKAIFSKAKTHTQGEKPELVITDGLPSYHNGFNKTLYDNKQTCEHVASSGIRARVNNNKVERLHNTVRERQKVMRGLQDDDTATTFNNGFKAFYNHIRPHQGLDGRTPAQAAGINLKLGRNRWMGMIQKSVEHERNNDAR
ncbi:DDE domain protein [uncultured archaeon]|nr:DDE domain protein [uncultured archaeon]